ncbi:hypothetical protein [Chryseobacterium sp. CBTAP 102]|uniref:hypothetical protein n=1 Tax=Chryseobacterium sp. CBTAP 102 TaxID=2135644 RepID=UPI000D75E177|nr:hypothetical protein [Chryseobacterium sp. CBTAP 102]
MRFFYLKSLNNRTIKVFINKRIPETGIEMLKETGLDVAHPERISEENLFLDFLLLKPETGWRE